MISRPHLGLHASLALGAFAGCFSSAIAAPTPGSKPNIVIFLADDLGAMDVGFNNAATFYETPNLDRLAKQSMRFTSAYAANPVCSPTRYSLLTGRYPTRARLTNWLPGVRTERFQGAELPEAMPLEETTISEALRDVGYHTAYVGKWHLGEKPMHWPEAQGFETNVGGYSAGAPFGYFPPYKNPRLTDGPPGEHLTLRLAEESAKLIQKLSETHQPFLLVHADYAVHNPVQAPEALVQKYREKAKRLGLSDQFGEETQYHVSAKGPRRVRLSQNHPAYAALVELMDQAVGRLLAELDRQHLTENTIFIFASDNGGLSHNEGGNRGAAAEGAPAESGKAAPRVEKATPMPTSNLPLRGGKGWLYEGGIRIPFLVRWPGVTQPGTDSAQPVMTIDIMPTALSAAGAKTQAVLDGRDLSGVLEGKKTETKPRELFWHYPHYSNQGGFPGGAVLSAPWKLLENYEDGSVMLYNLETDPKEQHDLASQERERTRTLRDDLHQWYKQVDAQFLRAAPDGPAPWRP